MKCQISNRCQEAATVEVIHHTGPKSSYSEFACSGHGTDIANAAQYTGEQISTCPIRKQGVTPTLQQQSGEQS